MPDASVGQLVRSGRSDKYGQIYVERVGNTGFDDADEPIAVLRAQDDLAYRAMIGYLNDCRTDPSVPAAQIASVERQIAAFRAWRDAHREKTRKPGVSPIPPSPFRVRCAACGLVYRGEHDCQDRCAYCDEAPRTCRDCRLPSDLELAAEAVARLLDSKPLGLDEGDLALVARLRRALDA